MIDRLELHNFKCFVDSAIELGPLNVFAGANGTGKSTFLQALLVLFQSFQSGAVRRNRLQLNGSLIDLGTGRDVLYKRSETDRFSVVVGHAGERQSITATVAVSESLHTLSAVLEPLEAPPYFLERKLFYLSADRLGPQKAYPMNLDESVGNEVGRRGEFAPLLYSRSRKTEVRNEKLQLENEEKQRFTDLESQFRLWMRRLFPGFDLRADSLDQLDSVLLGMNLQKVLGEGEFLRPSNIGFGVSIVLPIILTGLLAGAGTTLIVENPEAHLHPSAQSLVGEFLARVAAGGAQVFVETHSEHVVNGARIAFTNGVLAAADLRFFAFSKTEQYGSHKVMAVALDETGDFVERPEFFFDQADKDLRLIYRLG